MTSHTGTHFQIHPLLFKWTDLPRISVSSSPSPSKIQCHGLSRRESFGSAPPWWVKNTIQCKAWHVRNYEYSTLSPQICHNFFLDPKLNLMVWQEIFIFCVELFKWSLSKAWKLSHTSPFISSTVFTENKNQNYKLNFRKTLIIVNNTCTYDILTCTHIT